MARACGSFGMFPVYPLVRGLHFMHYLRWCVTVRDVNGTFAANAVRAMLVR